jgi:hypothetical protein
VAKSSDDLQALVAHPRESLDVELKRWMDPTSNEGRAKIAKGCIALRNNNGGQMIFGFQDDGHPDRGGAPSDVRSAFHLDVIQEIVARCSSETFEVEVSFADSSGQLYPIIKVPAGVRSPVTAKSTINGADGRALLKDNAVYVRTLNSNNTVSSAEARRGDWDALVRVCFDNREADIGAFVRRHLAGLNIESLATLVPELAGILHRPTDAERLLNELDEGRVRFHETCRERRLVTPDVGYRESAIDDPAPGTTDHGA